MSGHRFCTLGRWYASPQDAPQATALLERIDAKERARLRRGRGCLACRMVRMMARYWLGEPVDQEYEMIAAVAARRHSARALALLELILGQLLAARRRSGAAVHLDRGFAHGCQLLAPADYFVVLKRHALLHLLPPDNADNAMELEDLLLTARVIERMSAGQIHRPILTPPV